MRIITANVQAVISTPTFAQSEKPKPMRKRLETRQQNVSSLARGWFAKPPKKYQKGIDIYEEVKAKGLLIRHFATPGIEDFVRITIGTKEEMIKLLQAM